MKPVMDDHILFELLGENSNPTNLRVIKTARSAKAINEAANKGFRPLLRAVSPSTAIRSKYAIWQNRKTGEIKISADFRKTYVNDPNMDLVIDWTYYYPNLFKNPFAAYLVPQDILHGERVYLEDLIEDIVDSVWNQGDATRLNSAEAIWTGNDFEIQASSNDSRYLIG